MPELPDVEGFKRVFERHAAGKRIRGVTVHDVGVLRNAAPEQLDVLVERRFGQPRRHGKWLVCPTDAAPALLFHFGMTGSLEWRGEEHPHDRLVLALDDGELRYRDMRKLRGVWLALHEAETEELIEHLGPDALDVSRKQFHELLARRRGAVKAALMDQELIAGLGNLLVDEALFQARIDPRRAIPSLSDEERDELYRKVRRVLRESLPYGLVPGKRTWLTGARTEGICPRCGIELARVRIGGRTTLFCPREQA